MAGAVQARATRSRWRLFDADWLASRHDQRRRGLAGVREVRRPKKVVGSSSSAMEGREGRKSQGERKDKKEEKEKERRDDKEERKRREKKKSFLLFGFSKPEYIPFSDFRNKFSF